MLRGKHKKPDNLNDKRTSITLKTPSILDHTAKIEQKLTYLKQKITQKKKKSVAEKMQTVQPTLLNFITRIGLTQYINLLVENGIDSLEILKEIKQAQLQEIGILKGHALKIIVHIRKQQQKSKQIPDQSIKSTIKTHSKQREQTKPTLTIAQNKPQVQTSIDSIQTQSFPVNNTHKSFCLYCFTRSQTNFCSSNCQDLYQNMFSKYQANLQKVQENFIPKQHKKSEQLSDNQQFLQNFDFLFNPQINDFDSEQYEQIKQLIKK